jgi:oxaloacetate decarboxylase alpha subunit
MAEIVKKPVKITETILRDAHQSLIATRMTTEQMLPIVEKMDKVGYHAVECWGGATFDASLRFLKEDPWERLRKFKDGFKNRTAAAQALARYRCGNSLQICQRPCDWANCRMEAP